MAFQFCFLTNYNFRFSQKIVCVCVCVCVYMSVYVLMCIFMSVYVVNICGDLINYPPPHFDWWMQGLSVTLDPAGVARPADQRTQGISWFRTSCAGVEARAAPSNPGPHACAV